MLLFYYHFIGNVLSSRLFVIALFLLTEFFKL